MKPLAVLSVASEMFPLVKTGGLADVTGALPCALAAEGIAVRTLIPGYPVVMGAISGARKVLVMNDLFGGEARLLSVRHAGLDLLVLDAPHLFDRAGNPYLGPDGSDWPDNAMRFAALGLVAANIGDGALRRYAPSIIHAHDWQAGLAPAYLHYRGGARPSTIMTVHNLAFSGKAPRELLAPLGLPPRAFAIDGVEFHGAISMLKAGLQFADWITTVSPTYAAEIHAEPAGMGFSGLLNVRDAVLSGILNGIDTGIWNPATDIQIASPFDRDTLSKRVANKLALQKRMGLPQDAAIPLLGVVTRLTWQKGMDLLLSCLPMLRESGAQLVLVGSGDAQLEASFTDWAARDPDWLGCEIGYDEALAHQVQAGADAILVPSRFEPCGLTQLCALRYGAVPIVARVGGLADTVIDANPAALAACVATGIQFNPGTVDMLAVALRRALALYREPTIWRSLQMNGMACDVSWHGAAKQYARLYRNLVAARV